MAVMTPIKCFRKKPNSLEFYIEDYAGNRVLICTAADEIQLEWIAWTFWRTHGRHVSDWDKVER